MYKYLHIYTHVHTHTHKLYSLVFWHSHLLMWVCVCVCVYTYTWASQVALAIKNPPAIAGDARIMRSIPGLGRFPWRRAQQLTPVFLPRGSRGQRRLVGYSPLGHSEPDTTEATLHAYTYIHIHMCVCVYKEREREMERMRASALWCLCSTWIHPYT